MIIGLSMLVVCIAVVLLYLLGWLTPAREWPRATGWDRIPPADRPAEVSLPAGVRLQWLGHSGFVLEWHGTTLLLDPNTHSLCTVSKRVLTPAPGLPDPSGVDAVLISHAHYDHMDAQTLRKLGGVSSIVLPLGSQVYLRDETLAASAVPLAAGGSFRVGHLEIVAVAAAHNGNRFHPLQGAQTALGYIIRSGDDSIYYAGDTGLRNDFAAIRETYRPQAAILPIGAYAPSYPLRLFHLSPEDAVEAARILGARVVIPCHFGTFRLSFDHPASALPRFARAARLAGLPWIMPELRQSSREEP